MAEISFAKLEKLKPLPLGRIFEKKGASQMFRVIGPGNEVECFTGNRQERAETRKLWERTLVSESRFAHLVEWPVLQPIQAADDADVLSAG